MPQAHEDLFEIYCLIGLDNPTAAERSVTAIQERIEILAKYPRMGRRRPDIRPSMRILVKTPYLILYNTEPDSDSDRGAIKSVNIVRIVDGRRNLQRLV
jgi:toxin ParE1/3/4